MSNLQRNVFLSSLTTSGNAGVKPNGSLFAKGLGRTMPFQGSAVSSPRTILSEVAQDVYSVDGCGRAFDSGQLWVRHQVASDSSGDPAAFLNSYWTAVPDSVPAGFTGNNKRNVFPLTHINHSAGYSTPSFTGVPHGVIYNADSPTITTRPIRTADGIYIPKDSTDTFAYGPCNRNDEASSNGGGEADNGWSEGVGFHPGWRSLYVSVNMTNTLYTDHPGLWVDLILGQGINYAGLADVITQRINYGDLVQGFFPSTPLNWGFEVILDASATYCAAGVYKLTGFRQETSLGSPTLGNVNWGMRVAPRVDIPYPFTTSTGNLIAPGGIVTGSIPGF